MQSYWRAALAINPELDIRGILVANSSWDGSSARLIEGLLDFPAEAYIYGVPKWIRSLKSDYELVTSRAVGIYAGGYHRIIRRGCATILKSKVVDAETNEPIEGAVVVVVWMRPVFVPCMDSCSAFHDAAETVTDVQGNFSVDISMGFLANERNNSIYRPGYHRPGYYAAPWLTSREDPPPGESQVVRLIKATSLLNHSRSGYEPKICYQPAPNRWCVPPQKVKTYVRLTGIVRAIRASESEFPAQYSQPVPLHKAALQGDFRSVRSLLDSGANVDEQEKDGHTALMLAVEKSRVDLSDLYTTRPRGMSDDLWKMRAKILAANASRSDNMEVVRTLLVAGANPNLQTKNGETALSLAISTGSEISGSKLPGSRFGRLRSPDLVNTLLQGGANPNLKVGNGLTPLMIAAGRGLADIVNILLAAGAGETPGK